MDRDVTVAAAGAGAGDTAVRPGAATVRRPGLDRVIARVERSWAVVLGGLMLADLVLLVYMGRGTSFFYDDWDYVTHDFGGGLHSLLTAHNGHLSLIPIAIYKVMFHLVGLNHYAVFRLLLIALHLACAGLVFVLASQRLSRTHALLATALILFLGAAWEDLLWAFQIDYMLSVLAGLAAWLLLSSRWSSRVALGVCLCVVVSLASSSLGIAVLIGVAVEMMWRGYWRQWWVVLVPVALYALWYAGYGESEITSQSLVNGPGFAEDMAAAAFGGLVGRALDWGRPLAIGGALVVIWRLIRPEPLSPRLVGLLGTGLSLWAITAVARSTVSTPEASRYVYFGAVVIVLGGVELAPRLAPAARATAIAAVVVAAACITGLTVLHNGSAALRGYSKTVVAELGALQLAAAKAPPSYRPDTVRAPQIEAGPYLHTVRAVGSSPAADAGAIAKSDPGSRAAADTVLIALYTPALRSIATATPAPAATAPTLLVGGGATVSVMAPCVRLAPSSPAGYSAVLALPRGGALLRGEGPASATAAVKRFGDTFVGLPGTLAPRAAAQIALPPDAAARPWQLQVSSSGPVAVCG